MPKQLAYAINLRFSPGLSKVVEGRSPHFGILFYLEDENPGKEKISTTRAATSLHDVLVAGRGIVVVVKKVLEH